MFTRTLKLALSTGLVSLISLTASAAPHSMAKLDLNQDTYIDMTEFISGANQRFAKMDRDANGVVTQDERDTFKDMQRTERAQAHFARSDANGDGSISQQEFDNARAERDETRENHRAERQEKREATRAERQEKHQARSEQADGQKHRRGDREQFKRDANQDGVIDVAEITAAAEHAFARMDKDGDGLLSQDEQRHKKRRGERKHRRFGQ